MHWCKECGDNAMWAFLDGVLGGLTISLLVLFVYLCMFM